MTSAIDDVRKLSLEKNTKEKEALMASSKAAAAPSQVAPAKAERKVADEMDLLGLTAEQKAKVAKMLSPSKAKPVLPERARKVPKASPLEQTSEGEEEEDDAQTRTPR